MAGIRSFNSNVPHVYRYPEWTSGIDYPIGSVVAVEYIDSDLRYDVFIAVKDSPNRTINPKDDVTESWRVVFKEDPDLLDSDLVDAIRGLDSELALIRADIDSDILDLEHSRLAIDSDNLRMHDSDRHDFKAADSDILVTVFDALSDLDSELTMEIHDRKSVDSDINARIQALIDSEIAILFQRTDSDEERVQFLLTELTRRADSDIMEKLKDDSDIRVIIRDAIHLTLSDDSDQDSEIVNIKSRLDSEHTTAFREWVPSGNDFPWGPQPYVTNTDYFIDEQNITNHVEGVLWLVDHQNNTIYLIRNGVLWGTPLTGGLLTTEGDFGIAGYHYRSAIIEESPGDDADVAVYQNTSAAIPLSTNANLFTVLEQVRTERAVLVSSRDIEQAIYYNAVTTVQIDSDLQTLKRDFGLLDSDNDSDHVWFYHEIRSLDSDVEILKRDRDSDNLVIQNLQMNIDSERHDWRAGDSDLRYEIFGLLESDIRLSLNHDSELFAKSDSEENARRNADSDIYNKYTSVTPRWIAVEYEPANFTGAVSVDFNAVGGVNTINGATNIWFWDGAADALVIVDSDGSILYNEPHQDEPIEVSFVKNGKQLRVVRGDDTLQNATVTINGAASPSDDIFEFRIEQHSKDPIGFGYYSSIIDSDLNLHEWDSDNTAALVNIIETIRREIHDRAAGDSDILVKLSDLDSENKRMHDSDRHDFKAADSDLSNRITELDSDFNHGHIGGLEFGYDKTAAIQSGDTNSGWRKNGAQGANTGGTGGRGIGGFGQYNIGDYVQDNSGTPVTIANWVLSTNITRLTIIWEGVVQYYDFDTTIQDKAVLEKEFYANQSDSDEFLFYIGDFISQVGPAPTTIWQYYEVGILDKATYDLKFNPDSEYFTHDEKDDIITRSFDSIALMANNTRDRLNTEINDRSMRDDSELHDRKAADSDIRVMLTDLDSENQRMHDSDRHDFKAADSDLSDRITDNDSDIAYLYDVTVKFRGTIDPTVDQPHHTEIKAGDLYISTTGGRMTSGWDGVEDLDVKIGDALLYTDSDVWTFLGSGSGDNESMRFVNVGDIETYDTEPANIDVTLVANSDTSTGLPSNSIYLLSSDAIDKSEENFWLSRRLGPLGGGIYQHEAWLVLGGKQVWHVDQLQNFNLNYTTHVEGLWEYTRLADTGQNVSHNNFANGVTFPNTGTLDVYRFERKALEYTHTETYKAEQEVHDSDIIFNFKWLLDRYKHLRDETDSDLAILFQRTDSDENTLQTLETTMVQRIDSERHDWKAGDSDILVKLRDLDSENKRMHDSDRHDFKAADSDLSDRITDNDSDIDYLYKWTMKFRGSLDVTRESPTHRSIEAGDVYIATDPGVFGPGWASLSGISSVESGNAVMYTDSDDWIILGAGGAGFDSDFVDVIDNAGAHSQRSHRPLNKWNYARNTDTMLIEFDSDHMFVAEGTGNPGFTQMVDGFNVADSEISILFTEAGPQTTGTLSYVTENSIVRQVMIGAVVSGATQTPAVPNANTNTINGFSVTDSENQVVVFKIKPGQPIQRKDRIVYESNGHKSVLICIDGTNWKRVSPDRIDIDSDLALKITMVGSWNPENPPPDSDSLKRGYAWRASQAGWINGDWKGLDSEFVTENTLFVWNDSEWFRIGGDINDVVFKNYLTKTNDTWHMTPNQQSIDYASVVEVDRNNATFNVNYQGRVVGATMTLDSVFATGNRGPAFALQEQATAGQNILAVACAGGGAEQNSVIIFDEPVRLHMLSFRGRSDAAQYYQNAQMNCFTDAAGTQPVNAVVNQSSSYAQDNGDYHRLFSNPNVAIRRIQLRAFTNSGNNPGINGVRIHLANEVRSFPFDVKSQYQEAETRTNETTSFDNRDGVFTAWNIREIYEREGTVSAGWQWITAVGLWEDIPYYSRVFQGHSIRSGESGNSPGFLSVIKDGPDGEYFSDNTIYIEERDVNSSTTDATLGKTFTVTDNTQLDISDWAFHTVDSELRSEYFALRLADSDLDSDIKWLHRVIDSEEMARQDADSDLRVNVGKLFVQNTVPVQPIYANDVWVDTDDNTMYRWDSTNSNWIQIIGSV